MWDFGFLVFLLVCLFGVLVLRWVNNSSEQQEEEDLVKKLLASEEATRESAREWLDELLVEQQRKNDRE